LPQGLNNGGPKVGGRQNNGGTPNNNGSSSNNTIASGSATPLDLEGLIAGGGVFVTIDGTQYLAGINSFVSCTDINCDSDYGDISGCVSVSSYASWINEQISGYASSVSTSSKKTKLSLTGVRDYSTRTLTLNDAIVAPEPSALCLLGIAGMAFGVWVGWKREKK
jgi:hypothetical protein